MAKAIDVPNFAGMGCQFGLLNLNGCRLLRYGLMMRFGGFGASMLCVISRYCTNLVCLVCSGVLMLFNWSALLQRRCRVSYVYLAAGG
ncbi:MAG: hypothetical protein ACXWT4_13065 [Methylobacter sp.]